MKKIPPQVAAFRLALCVLALSACTGEPRNDSPRIDAPPVEAALAAGEGFLPVPDGRIWYREVGSGTGTPVILLHGGPGVNSYYLKVFEQLGDDRKVIRYDQLGSGKSGPFTDTTKMTVAHFVAELDSLRAHLGYDKVYILGHSWGTMLGFEYYRAHPEHVAGLILGSPCLDAAAWGEAGHRRLAALPDSSRAAAAEAERSGNFDTRGFQVANAQYSALYVTRNPPPNPADADSTEAGINAVVYNYMWGPAEFAPRGTLKTFDMTPYLPDVKVPTLFTVGAYDEADTAVVRRQAAMVPGAQYAVIAGAAHMTPWDAPGQSVRVARDFLRGVERGGKR
ncbi:MAG: proline iminopeptidase-family hydrolase [Gemmatimonadota bacterium]